MSDVRKLREAIYDLATDDDTAEIGDEAWYDKLWELLDPVIDARVERQLTPTPDPEPVHTHNAGEYRDPETGDVVPARGSMTFAEAEALLIEYQREKAERAR